MNERRTEIRRLGGAGSPPFHGFALPSSPPLLLPRGVKKASRGVCRNSRTHGRRTAAGKSRPQLTPREGPVPVQAVLGGTGRQEGRVHGVGPQSVMKTRRTSLCISSPASRPFWDKKNDRSVVHRKVSRRLRAPSRAWPASPAQRSTLACRPTSLHRECSRPSHRGQGASRTA